MNLTAAPATPVAGAPPREGPEPASETSKSLTIEVTPKAADGDRAVSSSSAGRRTRRCAWGMRGGGCSGFTYVIEFHDGAPRPRDLVLDYVETESGRRVRVVVDPKSLLYLSGSTLEWEQTVMQQGFKFVNPHEKAGCGCGHSFTV